MMVVIGKRLKMAKTKKDHGIQNQAFVENEGYQGAKPPNKVKPFEIIEDHPDETEELKCQFLGIPCPAQRRCLSAVGILAFLCWASTIQGLVVNGFVNAVISSLERRFDLSSTMTGVIAGSYDIGSMVTVIPITYFGGLVGSSKPKYISRGMFIMGLGSFLFCLPHFVTGPYLTPDVVEGLNSTDPKSEMCLDRSHQNQTDLLEETFGRLSVYKYFFIFGQILHGIGAAPLITLGTTFLDESVGKVSSPMYVGIFQTFFVVGPALGYLLGGSLLQIYVDLSLDGLDANLNPSHPIWVGAWWIGFLISGGMAWACAIFIGSYPPTLPSSEKKQQVSVSSKDESKLVGLKQMPSAIKSLLLNPTYMFISVGGAADGLVIAGLSAFLPKFIQSQYKFTASLSSGIVGLLVIPAGGLGTFTGGYIAKRFRLNRSQMLKMYIMSQMVTIPMALGFLCYCPNVNFSGVTIFQQEEKSFYKVDDLKISCNQNCSCNPKDFKPLCGEDNVMYYSACYAGCQDKQLDSENATEYLQCSCVDSPKKMAYTQPCTTDCQYFYGFAVLMFISIWFTFMSSMPNIVATMRSVENSNRSLALGLQSIILRLIGSIPGPVFFGAIIDKTCMLVSDSCLVYDNYSMSLYMMLLIVITKLVGVSLFCLALFFSLRLRTAEDEEENATDDTATNNNGEHSLNE